MRSGSSHSAVLGFISLVVSRCALTGAKTIISFEDIKGIASFRVTNSGDDGGRNVVGRRILEGGVRFKTRTKRCADAQKG